MAWLPQRMCVSSFVCMPQPLPTPTTPRRLGSRTVAASCPGVTCHILVRRGFKAVTGGVSASCDHHTCSGPTGLGLEHPRLTTDAALVRAMVQAAGAAARNA
eukprot:360591-Chlamydomonas_euryale.AAC.15